MPKRDISKLTDPHKIHELFLENIYKEAVDKSEFLWPDDAIRKLIEFWNKVTPKLKESIQPDKPVFHRIDNVSLVYKLHKYAVDLFYKTYFPSKKGAPPISNEYLDSILKLHEQKMTPREIAKKLKLPLNTPYEVEHSIDRIRKQIKTAKKRKAKQSE